MNRRGFLKLATLAALGATVDPGRLLWTPGARTFVLPPSQGWRPGLVFHPDAFFLVMAELNDAQREYNIWASNQAEIVAGMPFRVDQGVLRRYYELAQPADKIDSLYERDVAIERIGLPSRPSVVYLNTGAGVHVYPDVPLASRRGQG